MKTVGFVISHKENENRRAIVPEDLGKITNKEAIFIEKGYGSVLGFSDADYREKGIGGICSREEILKKDIICDPKIGDADYLPSLSGQTIWGWVHAVQNKAIADAIVKSKLTAYAWEDMYHMGRHSFWRNNEIAGEAAIMHAYLLHGLFPYNTRVAILGRGNTARGAMKLLYDLGADVVNFDRRQEALLKEEIGTFDVIVNCILWDTNRNDHIISKDDLKMMKPGAMIIDVSCDKSGAVETSIPTTIESPCYMVDGVRHYVVDHTPSLFYKTTSQEISMVVSTFVDYLIEDKTDESPTLSDSKIIENGRIIDKRIIEFQNKNVHK